MNPVFRNVTGPMGSMSLTIASPKLRIPMAEIQTSIKWIRMQDLVMSVVAMGITVETWRRMLGLALSVTRFAASRLENAIRENRSLDNSPEHQQRKKCLKCHIITFRVFTVLPAILCVGGTVIVVGSAMESVLFNLRRF